ATADSVHAVAPGVLRREPAARGTDRLRARTKGQGGEGEGDGRERADGARADRGDRPRLSPAVVGSVAEPVSRTRWGWRWRPASRRRTEGKGGGRGPGKRKRAPAQSHPVEPPRRESGGPGDVSRGADSGWDRIRSDADRRAGPERPAGREHGRGRMG